MVKFWGRGFQGGSKEGSKGSGEVEEAALLLVFWKYALYRVHGGLRI